MDALIGQVYEAALDRSLWPATMRAICAEFGAAAMTIRGLDYSSAQVSFSLTTGVSAEAEVAYRNHYVRTSPTIRYFRAHPDVLVVNNHIHTGETELDADDFHRDFVQGLCGARYSLTTCWPARVARHAVVHATLLRTRDQGPAEARLVGRFFSLSAHLQSALRVGERMASADAFLGAVESVYELFALGILMISDRGAVVYSNRAAREITDAADGIAIDATGLHALRRSEEAWLQRVLEDVISRESAVAVEVSITRKTGARPYGLNLVPIRGPSDWLSAHPLRAIVMISDPERTVSCQGSLAQAFDLTPTEARVLALLCAGQAPRSIAAALAIAPSTTRLHIEHLLKKSGCHRQTDLIRCALMGSTAWLMRSKACGETRHEIESDRRRET